MDGMEANSDNWRDLRHTDKSIMYKQERNIFSKKKTCTSINRITNCDYVTLQQV